MVSRALVASLIVVSFTTAHVHADDDDKIPGHTVSRPIDGGIQAAAFAAGLAAKLIPQRAHQLSSDEPMEMDLGVRDNFSRRASHISDGLLALSLAAPAIYLTGSTIDDVDGNRLLLYTQSMAINIALASITKELVQRPRPYTHSKDPRVMAYAKQQGDDAYLSFYSGHSALTFGAATTGAYLLGTSDVSPVAKSFAWGAGFGVAAMTATLRVRAGKHYYSDVLIGALVGITVGYAVPALHADDHAEIITGEQAALAGGSILAGMLIGRLLPLEKRHDGEGANHGVVGLQLTPTSNEHGMGLGLAGAW